MIRRLAGSLSILAVAVSACAEADDVVTKQGASHAWGEYHWARPANPFTLRLADNLSATWDPYLATTSSDWSASAVLDTTIVASGANPRTCRANTGRVDVCNAKYGANGWLGIASIWATGDHITKGTVKLNDTYFSTAKYNTSAWRNLVMCQEVGHTFGLDHQDEDTGNANLGSCMDYTSDPSTNQHPNAHDYEELALIYAHPDTTTTVAASAAFSAPSDADGSGRGWGTLVASRAGGRQERYVRQEGHETVITEVLWAD